MKKLSLVFFSIGIAVTAARAQNVGIGNNSPDHKLDVTGTIKASDDVIAARFIGAGTPIPLYKLHVTDGAIAITNSLDLKTWYFNYNSAGNYFQLTENAIPRLVIANGGNVGIGTNAPTAKLEVNGAARVATTLNVGGAASIDGNITAGGSAAIEQNITVGGTATIDGKITVGGPATINGNVTAGGTVAVEGNLTVNNGKGVLRSWNSSQVKYYTQEATVQAVLGPLGTSGEGTIAWPAGIFTSAPNVLVGDITSIGGSTGPLFRVQIVTYDATTTSCHFRLINTSNSAVDYTITWNLVLIGN